MQPLCFETSPVLPTIVTMPGLDGSGPDHWQTQWENLLPDCRRVIVDDWSNPLRAHWVDRLDHTLDSVAGSAIVVAHSLGCLTLAWWAKLRWTVSRRPKLLGAMLVAPPCVDGEASSTRLLDFRPAPRNRLPFPSLLIASRDDSYCSFAASQRLAEDWGSQFVDAGPAGHLNTQSGIGAWEQGVALLESLVASVADGGRSIQARRGSLLRGQHVTEELEA